MRRLTMTLDLPVTAEEELAAPYVIEALLTYVRGVETGAFGNRGLEKFKTITGVRLTVAHECVED